MISKPVFPVYANHLDFVFDEAYNRSCNSTEVTHKMNARATKYTPQSEFTCGHAEKKVCYDQSRKNVQKPC